MSSNCSSIKYFFYKYNSEKHNFLGMAESFNPNIEYLFWEKNKDLCILRVFFIIILTMVQF